jgi:hypothetical protein
MTSPETLRALTLYFRTQRLAFELEVTEWELAQQLKERADEINLDEYRASAAQAEAAFEQDRRDFFANPRSPFTFTDRME